MATIVFHIKDNAPPGEAVINLLENAGNSQTALGGMDAHGNDFLFELQPRPNNVAGDALDGRIEVLGLAMLQGRSPINLLSQLSNSRGFSEPARTNVATTIQSVAVPAGDLVPLGSSAVAAGEALALFQALCGTLRVGAQAQIVPEQTELNSKPLPRELTDDVFAYLGENQDRVRVLDFSPVRHHLARDFAMALVSSDSCFADEFPLPAESP